ncbi:MAG: rod shape-determining protein MreC [Actinomycetota bacterium]|nr:rod shape-determining protein MreC [Chloroflexota bacterium]
MHRRTGRGRVILLVFLALSIAIITLDFRQEPGGPLQRVKDISATIVAPIQRGLTSVARPVGDFFSSLGELSSLRTQNSELKAELADLEARATQAESLEDENRELSELLGLEESWAAQPRVAAAVIASGPSNYKWTVFIDKGTSDGVASDMAVISNDGLVGKVLSAQAHVSSVLLLIDPNAAAGARLDPLGGLGPRGVVKGNGGDEMLSLGLIGTRREVEEGDEVVTSGYDGGIFPPDIPIGIVAGVAGDTANLQQEIEVDPHVDFTSLDYVYVLTESGSRLSLRDGK